MSDLRTAARERTRADLAYQSLYCAAIGGSVIALFFLVVDTWNGRMLFTPSLMWGVLFGGADAAALDAANSVRLEWVAWATALHLAAFGVIGTAVTLIAHEVELHTRRPILALFILFLVIAETFIIVSAKFMPGVMEVLGWGKVLLANALAAGGITAFLWASHREEAWEHLKEAVRA